MYGGLPCFRKREARATADKADYLNAKESIGKRKRGARRRVPAPRDDNGISECIGKKIRGSFERGEGTARLLWGKGAPHKCDRRIKTVVQSRGGGNAGYLQG